MSPTNALESSGLLTAVAHAADLICVFSTTGVILYASDAAERLLGYEPGELIGRNSQELYHPDEAAALAQAVVEAEQGTAAVRRVHRLRAADGSFVWLESTGQSVELDGQSVLVVVSRDATSQVRTGREVILLRDRVTALVKVMNDPVVLVDSRLRTIASSKGGVQLFGSTNGPAHRLSVSVFVSALLGPAEVQRVVQATRTAMATRRVQFITVKELSGLGTEWTVTCTPLAASVTGPVDEALLAFEPRTVSGRDRRRPGLSTSGSAPARSEPGRHLTPRERQVLSGLAEGLDTHELATRLQISEHTVRGHIKAVLQKLHAHTQLQAVLEGMRVGAVPSATDEHLTHA